jgi:hypothetical protein
MAQQDMSIWISLIDLAKIVLPLIIVAFLSYKLGNKKSRYEKKLEFITKQITEFYSPMLGFIYRIEASNLLQNELSKLADETWKEIAANNKEHKNLNEEFKPFQILIESGNKTTNEEVLPLFYKMHDVFTQNYWLAEDSTKQHYLILSRYVDIWRRFQANSIPRQVLWKMEKDENLLIPFKMDMENKLGFLKKSLLK